MVFASNADVPNVQTPTEVASKSAAEKPDASVQEQVQTKKRVKKAKCNSGSCANGGIFAVIVAGIIGVGALLASIFLGSQSSCCG